MEAVMILVFILQGLYRGTDTGRMLQGITIALTVLFGMAGVLFGILCCRKKKRRILRLLLVILCACYCVKLIPYCGEPVTKVTPELVISSDTVAYDEKGIYVIYRDFGILSQDSAFQPEADHTEAQQWLNTYIDDRYTYIVSFEQEIQSISYTIWDSYDFTLAPLHNIVYRNPKFETAEGIVDTVYVYRIPKAAIEHYP